VADRAALPPAGARGRDEVDARLWPLGSGDSRLGKGAVLFRNELVVADAAAGAARAAKPGEVRRLGKHAAIVVLAVGGGRDRGRCFGRWV